MGVFDGDGEVALYEVGDCPALMDTVNELAGRGHGVERALSAFSVNVATLLRLTEFVRLAAGRRAHFVKFDRHGSA